MIVGMYEGTQLRTSMRYNEMRVNPTVNFHSGLTTVYHENHAVQGYTMTNQSLAGSYGKNGCMDVRITGTDTGTPSLHTPMIAFNNTANEPFMILTAEL
tara:strand:- start:196 stop:492 length:297 start_codon:yes stop_codon:yes gene_type:complete